MKKYLLIWLLFLWGVTLVWCSEPEDVNVLDADDNEWFVVAEWYCEDEWWEIEIWEEWDGQQPVCFYEDGSYCYIEDLYDGLCSRWEFYYLDDYDELAACDAEWEDIVCGKDGNTYYNGCYLDFAWVEEETELAEVIDWKCVFG